MNDRNLPPLGRTALALVLLKLVAHLATNLWTPYEFHRDAFLYTAMGTHLRLWHMDFPPFMALLAQGVRGTIGSSYFALHVVPALAGTGVLLLAVQLTREFGGSPRAQWLVALAILANPLFLRTASVFQPIVFDQLWWLLCLYALARLANGGNARWWLVLGVGGGLGLLTKFSIAFVGAGIVVGVLLTPLRRSLVGPWPWIAAALVLLLGSPSVAGQLLLGFPFFEQMGVLRERQLARVAFGEFMLDQVLMQPAAFLLMVIGAVGLARLQALARFRAIGWAAAATFVILVVLKGKSYYFGPMHPVLIAAGAVALEQLRGASGAESRTPGPRPGVLVQRGLATALVAYGILAVPFGLPVIPPEPMARFSRAVGITTAVRTNWGEQLPLPQDFADMLGWREKVEGVARVYRRLTPEEQREVVLYGRNYGQAGALDFYGPALGLPPVVSQAGSFFLFGPGERPGRIILALGVEPGEIDDITCASLVLADRVSNPWGVPEERDVPIVLCRDPNHTIQEVWRRVGRPQWG